jgi:bifunctional non-homologous end joining protein LigD
MPTPRNSRRRTAKDSATTSAASSPPTFITPMAALPVDRLPEGPEWAYEVKFDGYRALLMKNGTELQIRSRNDRNLTKSYPAIAMAAARLRADRAVVDGEIVALDENGRPSFQALQHRSRHKTGGVVFYAFDLLNLNGEDLTTERWEQRRERLRRVIGDSGLLLSEELPGSAAEIVGAVRGLGLEGVIAKKRASRYEAGERSGEWMKLKLDRQQEFVVGGYRPGSDGVDALLVGVYEGKVLQFAGKVRAGFVRHTRREIARKLAPLIQEQCPFPELPDTKKSRWGSGVMAEDMKEMRWVRPAVVAQIRFVEWTEDGRLRHAAFLGVRDDKKASEVQRE